MNNVVLKEVTRRGFVRVQALQANLHPSCHVIWQYSDLRVPNTSTTLHIVTSLLPYLPGNKKRNVSDFVVWKMAGQLIIAHWFKHVLDRHFPASWRLWRKSSNISLNRVHFHCVKKFLVTAKCRFLMAQSGRVAADNLFWASSCGQSVGVIH